MYMGIAQTSLLSKTIITHCWFVFTVPLKINHFCILKTLTTCAIVGAILAGSSSDKEIWRSIGLLPSILCLKIFAIKIGIHLKSLETLTTLVFHSMVL